MPLIVDVESGVNDMLDRDGSRTPIQFPHLERSRQASHRRAGGAGRDQVETGRPEAVRLQAGEGICTDMRAVRKDYFLDHDHSAYVDQWDWERAITAEQRNARFPRKRWSARSGR